MAVRLEFRSEEEILSWLKTIPNHHVVASKYKGCFVCHMAAVDITLTEERKDLRKRLCGLRLWGEDAEIYPKLPLKYAREDIEIHGSESFAVYSPKF